MVRDDNKAVPSHVQNRIDRFREQMARKRIDAFLVTNRVDYFYLTGSTAEDSALLVTPKQMHLITDTRFDESVSTETPWLRKHLRKLLLVNESARVMKKLKLKSAAIQGESMSVTMLADLRKECSPIRIKPAPNFAKQMRRIKDEEELRIMGRAVALAEEAFQEVRRQIQPGMTENEAAGRLEYEMKRRGSSAPAFPSIVAEGPNASLPHAKPGERIIVEGSAVLFDWGATVGFYHSDLTRVVALGSMPARIREIYEIVLEAQNRAIAGVRAGARVCDVDAIARKFIKSAGYGKAFAHGLGHGLGLDVHESPPLSWRSKEPLEPGMVVTVEPGIYLPGVGGVRIEDDVCVTSNGARVLSSLPKTLKDVILN